LVTCFEFLSPNNRHAMSVAGLVVRRGDVSLGGVVARDSTGDVYDAVVHGHAVWAKVRRRAGGSCRSALRQAAPLQ
jgi:hypothetical protein